MSLKPRTKRGEARRAQILQAAEKVFGTRGYADTSVADITRAAQTAQGTLYIYFKGKEEIFAELVEEMGHLTREVISQSVADAKTRLDAERRGLEAFLRFVAERPELYRIVEEAQFVDPDAYKAYFSGFARAYQQHLEWSVDAGQIRPGNCEIRAWALMGLAKTLGERFVLWDRTVPIEEVVAQAFDMIENGLRT